MNTGTGVRILDAADNVYVAGLDEMKAKVSSGPRRPTTKTRSAPLLDLCLEKVMISFVLWLCELSCMITRVGEWQVNEQAVVLLPQQHDEARRRNYDGCG
jgi:hypothetical protein